VPGAYGRGMTESTRRRSLRKILAGTALAAAMAASGFVTAACDDTRDGGGYQQEQQQEDQGPGNDVGDDEDGQGVEGDDD
jgi:hypothetical protein